MWAYLAGLGIPLYLVGIGILVMAVVGWFAVEALREIAEKGLDVNVNVTVGFKP